MTGVNPLLVIGGLGLFMVVFWPLTLLRAMRHIMTHAFFETERRLESAEYRRFVWSTTLLMALGALALVLVAPNDKHPHPEYFQPIGLVRLFLASALTGVVLGVGSWMLFRIQMKRLAKFHHPNLSTWKGVGFQSPKKRKMTPDEREAILNRMDLADYLEFICRVGLSFVLLSFFLVSFSLMFNAPSIGFIPALMHFTHHLISVAIALAVLSLVIGTAVWLLGRFFVWLGWSRTYA